MWEYINELAEEERLKSDQQDELLMDCGYWGANQIIPGLYLGSLDDALQNIKMQARGITHILTIAQGVKPAFPDDFRYYVISLADSESVDLLSYFSAVFQFITEAISKGSVLVHCMAGISRSATLVIAYLMAHEKKTFYQAVELVTTKRPCVSPNSGFIAQLKLFEKLGCSINPLNPDLIKHLLTSKLTRYQHIFEIEEQIDLGNCSINSGYGILYNCKQCNHNLFYTTDIFTITSDKIYIIPLKWMGNVFSHESGKIKCNNCKNELGNYIWHGSNFKIPDFIINVNTVNNTTSREFSLLIDDTQGLNPVSANIVAIEKSKPVTELA